MEHLRITKQMTWMREFSSEGCSDCRHYDPDNLWCALQDLPAAFNPVLTARAGVLGMACMGFGYESTNPDQLEIPGMESQSPF